MGRRAGSSNKRKVSKNDGDKKQEASFLAKLKMLRDFVGGNIDESNLTQCLKQSNYNVELAAERLITGQYKTSPTTESRNDFYAKVTPSTSVKKKPRISNASAATISKTPKRSTKVSTESIVLDGEDGGTHFLLCQRWLVGRCTYRNGRVNHKEPLHLSSTRSGPSMVRFKGSQMEGALPTNLCCMLSPLLRSDKPLISMQCEALMEERNVPIGGEVPLSLSVFLEDPGSFFNLFEADAAINATTATLFFDSKKVSRLSKKRNLHMPMTEAAFKLLQWAEYGDVPDFDTKQDGKSDTSDDSQVESSSEENETDPIVFREDQFEAESGNNGNDKASEWAKTVVESSCQLEEMPDPDGLASGISLRPYQRQALYWMMRREQNDGNREELHKEMTLLSELARKASTPGASLEGAPSKSILCECGPVRVSEAAAKKSVTLDGQINPVSHPLWQRRFLAKPGMVEAVCFYVNELFGAASSNSPNPPRQCVGGILSDAMGLGKTVMLLSLVMKSKEVRGKDIQEGIIAAERKGKDDPSAPQIPNTAGTTLVVTPLSLLTQWEGEIATKTSLSHHVYYGDTTRKPIPAVDVVLTTYGTVQSELVSTSKKDTASDDCRVLLNHDWERLILDEAHCIKNPDTVVAKACCGLHAEKRWCVTGTPIQNSLQDVHGLLKFLRHEPWCEAGFWKAAITSVLNSGDTSQGEGNESSGVIDVDSSSDDGASGSAIAIDRVKRLLAPIILRRTKDTLTKDGKPILTLPPVETSVVQIDFSSAEREFYNSLLDKSQSVFDGFLRQGTANKSWFTIFSLLQRLRQACDHVALTVKAQLDQSDFSCVSQTSLQKSKRKQREMNGAEGIGEAFLDGLLEKFQHARSHKTNQQLETSSFINEVARDVSKLVESGATLMEEECPICLENTRIEDAVFTQCGHIFCRDCLVSVLRTGAGSNAIASDRLTCPDGTCPSCNEEIKASSIIKIDKSQHNGRVTATLLLSRNGQHSVCIKSKSAAMTKENIAARRTLESAIRGAASSKLRAVIDELHKVWELDPRSKVVIFSQYLGCLNLLETSLLEKKIPFNRLDGKMTLKERVKALEDFGRLGKGSSDPSDRDSKIGSVLLVSMKAGGVGLNLVAASSVFIVDPWWNAAVEDQCINRIHRIGQTAPIVRVRKFIVNDSVEERILSLQQRKKGMANDILSDETDGELSKSRPTLDDFKILFGR